MFILNYEFPLNIFVSIRLCTLVYPVFIFVTDYFGPDAFLRNEEMETEETFFVRFLSLLGARRASLNMGWMCWSGNPLAYGIILGGCIDGPILSLTASSAICRGPNRCYLGWS